MVFVIIFTGMNIEGLELLLKLQSQKDVITKELKEINKKIEYLTQILSEEMFFNEVRSLKTKMGDFSLRVDLYASAKNTPKLIKWLKENGEENLVKETVNAQSLSRVIREKLPNKYDIKPLKDELPEELRDLINIFIKPSISIRNKKEV